HPDLFLELQKEIHKTTQCLSKSARKLRKGVKDTPTTQNKEELETKVEKLKNYKILQKVIGKPQPRSEGGSDGETPRTPILVQRRLQGMG
ncbi:hypothetical protein PMAYCL1PPCAC_28990, partial [Pristionchus mayeri]